VGALTAAAVLGFWLLLTLAAQFPNRLPSRFRRLDALLLRPRWHFFAPVPDTRDHFLLFRDRLAGGEWTPWRAALGPPPRRWTAGVWNPAKFEVKLLVDLHALIVPDLESPRTDGFELYLSPAYLPFLSHVMAREVPPGAEARQFAGVVRDAASGRMAISMLSAVHPFESRARTSLQRDPEAGSVPAMPM
jgi:hypothetical protein